MTERPAHKDGEPRPRYPYIGMVGSISVGKSTLAGAISETFEVDCFWEEFQHNPHLKPFYNEGHPEIYSFECQMTFLADCANHLSKLRGHFLDGARVHDSSMAQNLLIAKVQAVKMGYMTSDQYDAYISTYKNLSKGERLPQPDVYIAVIASKESVREGIINRGREMEVQFMEKFPEYFDTLTEDVQEWIEDYKGIVPIIVVNKDETNFIDDQNNRESLIKDVRGKLAYYIDNEHQLNGIGSDGAELIFPDFLRPKHHVVDVPPGAPSSRKKFSGT